MISRPEQRVDKWLSARTLVPCIIFSDFCCLYIKIKYIALHIFVSLIDLGGEIAAGDGDKKTARDSTLSQVANVRRRPGLRRNRPIVNAVGKTARAILRRKDGAADVIAETKRMYRSDKHILGFVSCGFGSGPAIRTEAAVCLYKMETLRGGYFTKMSHSLHNLRAFWFPTDKLHPQFVTTTSHRFTIEHGEDNPDLSPFVGNTCVHRRHFRIDGSTFTVFHSVGSVGSGMNMSLRNMEQPIDLQGTVMIFRRGVQRGRLVNMRRGDRGTVCRLIQWCVINCFVDCALTLFRLFGE